MDSQKFEKQLAVDGFSEIETKQLPPTPESNLHVHDCAIRGLVLDGMFIVRLSGRQVNFGPGDIFNVAAGDEHSEEVGPDGASVLVGKKYD